MLRGRVVLVLFPFLDGVVGHAKAEQFSQLRHGQRQVNPFLAQVFAEGLNVSRVTAQLPEMG